MDDDSALTVEEKPVAKAVELKESIPEETPTKAAEYEDGPNETIYTKHTQLEDLDLEFEAVQRSYAKLN